MEIKVLGPGCANCTTLEKRTIEAMNLAGVDADIEKVTDYAVIASYGIMSTPALVIDEQVVVSGRVPKVGELQTLLSEVQS
jgi:small redox-active disulfide protein 2